MFEHKMVDKPITIKNEYPELQGIFFDFNSVGNIFESSCHKIRELLKAANNTMELCK